MCVWVSASEKTAQGLKTSRLDHGKTPSDCRVPFPRHIDGAPAISGSTPWIDSTDFVGDDHRHHQFVIGSIRASSLDCLIGLTPKYWVGIVDEAFHSRAMTPSKTCQDQSDAYAAGESLFLRGQKNSLECGRQEKLLLIMWSLVVGLPRCGELHPFDQGSVERRASCYACTYPSTTPNALDKGCVPGRTARAVLSPETD